MSLHLRGKSADAQLWLYITFDRPEAKLCVWCVCGGVCYVHVHGGSPQEPGVGSPSRKRYTQYVEHNRKGHPAGAGEDRKGTYNGGWRDGVCYGAEKC
jgi:hypothetical protein